MTLKDGTDKALCDTFGVDCDDDCDDMVCILSCIRTKHDEWSKEVFGGGRIWYLVCLFDVRGKFKVSERRTLDNLCCVIRGK